MSVERRLVRSTARADLDRASVSAPPDLSSRAHGAGWQPRALRGMVPPMSPQHGGRFSLRWLDEDAERARYALELSTASGAWSARVDVARADGALTFEWQGAADAPPWLEQYARAALREAWRGHGERGWPRRLQRWRPEPSAREPKDGPA